MRNLIRQAFALLTSQVGCLSSPLAKKMKPFVIISLLGLFLSALGCQASAKNQPTEEDKTELREYVDRMAKAFQQHDADTLVDLSLSRLVNLSGGKEAYKDIVAQTFESLAKNGVELVAYSVGEISDVYPSDDGLVVFIPYKTEMKIKGYPNGMSETFLIGVKEDNGWKFMDSNGIRKRPEMLREVVPGLPQGIELPTNKISTKRANQS